MSVDAGGREAIADLEAIGAPGEARFLEGWYLNFPGTRMVGGPDEPPAVTIDQMRLLEDKGFKFPAAAYEAVAERTAIA